MRHRIFGSTGRRVPVIGLGTWEMEKDPRDSVFETIRCALDLGAGHIDTAEMYGDGAVEELVGQALGGRREEAFLVTKVLPEKASRQGTRKALAASLRRLGTDYLDLYLLHWLGPHPLEETVEAFEELRREGSIRAWGVSNLDEHKLEEVRRAPGGDALACDQVLYHLEERAVDHAVAPWCRDHDVALVAYSPLGQGAFPAPGSPGGKTLAEVAERHGATPRQVALAFLLRRPGSFVIPKTSKVAHLRENVAAAELSLDAEDVELLERAFPRGPRRPGVPTL
jgi:diketogulonate reductase-like aldo/keto reductase